MSADCCRQILETVSSIGVRNTLLAFLDPPLGATTIAASSSRNAPAPANPLVRVALASFDWGAARPLNGRPYGGPAPLALASCNVCNRRRRRVIGGVAQKPWQSQNPSCDCGSGLHPPLDSPQRSRPYNHAQRRAGSPSVAEGKAGLTIEQAVKKLAITGTRKANAPARLQAIEAGEVEPTRRLLVQMSVVYRRSLLTFYMSAPPPRGSRGRDFRTAQPGHAGADVLVDALLRDVGSRQAMVKSILADETRKPLRFPLSTR